MALDTDEILTMDHFGKHFLKRQHFHNGPKTFDIFWPVWYIPTSSEILARESCEDPA